MRKKRIAASKTTIETNQMENHNGITSKSWTIKRNNQRGTFKALCSEESNGRIERNIKITYMENSNNLIVHDSTED